MKLSKILKGIPSKITYFFKDINIESIEADSKLVKKNSLFVAIKGSRLDGHCFIGEAIRNGASCIVVENDVKVQGGIPVVLVKDTRLALAVLAKNFYKNPAAKFRFIGITGTNGKTTVSYLIERILARDGVSCGRIGTINYDIGSRLIRADRTTPDAVTLNRLFAYMHKNGIKNVIMEVSSHALQQKRIIGIEFDICIFTNLGRDHLDYHRTMKNYLNAKALLFKNLKRDGIAILNMDSKYYPELKRRIKHRILTYGLNNRAFVFAEPRVMDLDRSYLTVKIGKRIIFDVKTSLIGVHNIYNILAAVSGAFVYGIEYEKIKEGIESLKYIPGRLERIKTKSGFYIFIDYAHTPEALKSILMFLTALKRNRLITVFGCGGERDRSKRPLMGGVSQRFSDFVFITNDNPRRESQRKIVREILNGMEEKNKNYKTILDREKAIKEAILMAEKNDIVLVAGKGHENVQVIGSDTIPFSDKKIIKYILKRYGR